MILRSCVLVCALVAALQGCSAEPAAPLNSPVEESRSPAGLALVPVEIQSGSRIHRFTVEFAETPEQQEHGLMLRPKVGPDDGMIFPVSPPRETTFWMRNTMVPLDMIFIRGNGTIARIAVNTVPYSLDLVPSGEPVAAVLELAGGRTIELGIKEGDRVVWRQP